MSDDAVWVSRFDIDPDNDSDGIRLAVKDCIDIAGLPTVVGCEPIAELAELAAADADVVLAARAAGARIVGKTNLTELCWTASGVNKWSGTPVNPLDPARIPGGSSSGSAVAVALGQADVALGTDTGGSVRIPAACCGVTGLKTTWGRISLRGVYPLAPSLDTVGPLGADVAAVDLGMRLIDPSYGSAADLDAAGSLAAGSLAVGRLRPDTEVDPAVDAAVDRALAAAGISAPEVTGLDLDAVALLADILIDGEGYRANEYLLPYVSRLSSSCQEGMAAGAKITDGQLADAWNGMRSIRDWFGDQFRKYQFLVMPTLVAAPTVLGGDRIPLTVLTMPVNIARIPALALPVPDGPAGLPASLQLIGQPGSEESLIAIGRLIESAIH
jgi:amidase